MGYLASVKFTELKWMISVNAGDASSQTFQPWTTSITQLERLIEIQGIFSILDASQMLMQTLPSSILNNASVWHYVWSIHLEVLCMNLSHSVWWDCIRLPALHCSVRVFRNKAPHSHSSSKHFLCFIHVWFCILLAEGHSGNCRRNIQLHMRRTAWKRRGIVSVLPYFWQIAQHIYILLFLSSEWERGSWVKTELIMLRLSLACCNRKYFLFLRPSFLTQAVFLCYSLLFPVYLERCVCVCVFESFSEVSIYRHLTQQEE